MRIDPGPAVTAPPDQPLPDPDPEPIGRRAAINVAREQGVVDVYDVDRDGDVYNIRGEDDQGRRTRLVIDAYSGRVLEIVAR